MARSGNGVPEEDDEEELDEEELDEELELLELEDVELELDELELLEEFDGTLLPPQPEKTTQTARDTLSATALFMIQILLLFGKTAKPANSARSNSRSPKRVIFRAIILLTAI